MLEGPRRCTILCFNVHTTVEYLNRNVSVVVKWNGPFAASGHMVHAGGQAAHWDIQNKENSNLS